MEVFSCHHDYAELSRDWLRPEDEPKLHDLSNKVLQNVSAVRSLGHPWVYTVRAEGLANTICNFVGQK